jgi:hypothetical protein
MSRFGELLGGKKAASAPAPQPVVEPTPEPVVERLLRLHQNQLLKKHQKLLQLHLSLREENFVEDPNDRDHFLNCPLGVLDPLFSCIITSVKQTTQ